VDKIKKGGFSYSKKESPAVQKRKANAGGLDGFSRI
jgi:hypothetical protein